MIVFIPGIAHTIATLCTLRVESFQGTRRGKVRLCRISCFPENIVEPNIKP